MDHRRMVGGWRVIMALAAIGTIVPGCRRATVTGAAGEEDARIMMDGPTGEWDARTPRLVVQTGHGKAVTSVAFALDGCTILTGSDDNTVRLWDAATGHEIQRLTGHGESINTAALAPDSRTILIGGFGGTAWLWDVTTGREIRRLQGHGNIVISVAFAPDGRTILTGSSDKTTRLWDTATGREIRRLEGHSGPVNNVAFAPDGRTILTGSYDKTARLWDAATGREIRRLEGHGNIVTSVAFAAHGRTILTGSMDGTARLWDAVSGREIRRFEGPGTQVASVAFAPDGRTILTGSNFGTGLWDTATGREIRRFEGCSVQCVAFGPDGRTFLAGSLANTAQLWDVTTGREIRRFEGHGDKVTSVAAAVDGRTILTGSFDGTARLWDLTGRREIRRLAGHESWITSVAFASDGCTVLTGSEDGTARLWNADTGREIQRFGGHEVVMSEAFDPDGRKFSRVERHEDVIESVAFAPNSRTILTGSRDKTARLWDAATGKEIRRFEHGDFVTSVVFAPDGRSILTGSEDKTARLWDAATGKEIRRFEHEQAVTSVAFAPDGSTILTGSWDTARLLKAVTGREIRRLEHRVSNRGTQVFGLTSVAFAADGRTILTGSRDGTARLWDAVTGSEIRRLAGHGADVTSVAFVADGRTVLTGSEDKTARLWDAATGRELCQLVSFNDGTWAVVDPSGRYDASNGGRIDGLHWVVGNEPIELEQLKDRYYDPGLLAKHLKLSQEPLRTVDSLAELRLHPQTEVAAPGPGDPKDTLSITLTDRGGGIGKVVVKINGKEVNDDARGSSPDSDPRPEVMRLAVPLADDPRLIPGIVNRVEVIAYNTNGSLRSRGKVVELKGEGLAQVPDPELWAVVIGTADYIGTEIDLRFAARDAEAFAKALAIAAGRLLSESKVHITVLSTDRQGEGDRPTKANIQTAFQHIAAHARPTDLLVVYLSGHGVAPFGFDEYFYLTADARSLELNDLGVRKRDAVSGAELTDLIRAIPAAGKQVLILDTCAAGLGIERLGQPRAPSGDQVRALERVKDRNGLHLLAGAAADASSYEASRYGQGLLTYSLLLGMTGPGLKGTELDVLTWFGYARDEVPELARGIGGIQVPLLSSPRPGASFPVGRLEPEDRAKVPLSKERPLVLRAEFQEEASINDVLGLAGRVNG